MRRWRDIRGQASGIRLFDPGAAIWPRPSRLKAVAADRLALGPALREMSPRYGWIRVPVMILTGD